MRTTGPGSVSTSEEERNRAWAIGGMIEPIEAPTMIIIAICSGLTLSSARAVMTRKPMTVAAAIASPSREPARVSVMKIAAMRPLGERPNRLRRVSSTAVIVPSRTWDSA
nr:hypothetical protein [Brevibacterium ihuae]